MQKLSVEHQSLAGTREARPRQSGVGPCALITNCLRLVLAALIAVLFAPIEAGAQINCNLAPNGSFESPVISGAFVTSVGTLSGWTVVGGNVDLLRNYNNASNGAQSIDMYGSLAGTIQQTFSGLTPGATYTFSIDYSGVSAANSRGRIDLDNGAGFQALATLGPVANYVANPSYPASGPYLFVTWSTYTNSFVATGTQATMRFVNTGLDSSSGTGLFIDNFKFGSNAPCPAPLNTCTADQTLATQRYWFFGQGGAIDFGVAGTTPAPFLGNSTANSEGSTVITDSSGALQFWSNGQTVFDRNGNPMPNGTGLFGAPSATQTVAAFPALGQPGKYFVVTTSTDVFTAGQGPNNQLHYSVVDMSLNGGLGAVTATKNVLLGADNTASEALLAVPNASGTGFWVLTYTNGSPNVLAYQFDSNGPTGPVAVSAMSTANGNTVGTLNVSADGTQIVQMTTTNPPGSGVIRVMDFNAATGQVSQRFSWSAGALTSALGPTFPYSAEFSPNGDYVYSTNINYGGALFRYNLAGATTSAQVKATEQNLGGTGVLDAGAGGQIRRGPDGRMYIADFGSNSISVVNTPDGPTPGLVVGGQPLAPSATSYYGLPQMVTGCPPPTADLAITKTDNSSIYYAGTNVTYSMVVTNIGPSTAPAAQITDPLPSGITTASWTCTAAGGAACGAGSGSGALSTTASLPIGGSVTYALTMAVPPGFTGVLVNTATVAPGGNVTDTNLANNSATDLDTQGVICGSGIAQTIAGGAQAWTTDSAWQSFAGNTPDLALNAPNNQGVQLFSAQASSLELDLATVVPSGQTISVFLAKLASASFDGPVLIQSSLDGNTWGTSVTTTPTATEPSYAPYVYIVPAQGARYIRIVPQPNGGAGTAVKVDAVSYSFQYCECAAAVNLVAWRSFEEAPVCTRTSAPFGPWSPIMNTIDLFGPTCTQGWLVPDGSNSVDLDGATTGGIQQTITGLNPGQTYNLTFYMSFNPAGGVAAASMRVQIGNFNQIYTSASNAYVAGFNRIFVEFTAQSATEVLQFHSLTGTNNATLLAGGGAPGYGVVVDDIRVTTKYCDDFSDALASYGAASHTGTGPQLGAVRDNEAVGTPSASATGDDAAGTDDEDGLQSINVYTGASIGSATVTALNQTASPATLAGWIDFNGNGVFDTSEGATATVPAGTIALTPFTLNWSGLSPVPLATGATTFARFRIGTSAAELAAPVGAASNGEVEDHLATVTALANVSLTKTATTGSVLAGEPIVYELVASNAGPSPATNVTVTDSLPPGTTFLSASAPAGWACAPNGSAVVCTTPTLGVNQSATITITVRAPNEPASVTNTAKITSEVPDPDPVDPPPVIVIVTPKSDLTISKVSTPNPHTPGDPLTYTIIVSNVGPSTVTGAAVSDTLPAVVTAANWTWSCAPNTAGAVCGSPGATNATAINTSVNLPPGGSVTFLASGEILSGTTGVLTNTATVTEPAGVFDPTPGNNLAMDTNNASLKSDLQVSKTATPNPFVPGQTLTYTIVASNAGPSDALGARVQDAFPPAFAGFTWTCVPSTGAACPAPSGGTGNIDVLVDLAAGASVTFTSTGAVPSSYVSSANNSVTIRTPVGTEDPVPPNNTTVYENPPNIVADLKITKTQAPDPYVPGSEITYSLLVENLGPSDVTNARVNDSLPGLVTGVTWTCAAAGTGASCATANGINVVDAFVTLPVGTTATFTIAGEVVSSASGILSNSASVTEPAGVTDLVPGNNLSTWNSGGAPLADLAVVKTASPSPYTPGGPLTFTIVVSNTGPSDALNAHVQDLFPPELSAFTWTCAPSAGAATCSVPSGMSQIDTYVDLPAGGAVTFTASGTVPPDTTGTVTNTATVAPPPLTNDPNLANNRSDVSLGYGPQADLSMTKTSTPNPYVPGSPITYTIVATNAGPSVLFGGRVRDGAPAVLQNLTWTCSAVDATCPAASGVGNIDALVDIAPGGTVTFSLTADVPGGTRGTLVNAATIVPPPGTDDPVTPNNTGTNYNPSIPIPGPADLQITQEFPGVAPPNGLLTFRLRTRNLGSHVALNPYMTGMIPPGTTFVSVTPSDGGFCNTPGNPPAPDPVSGYPIPGAATEPLKCTWPGLMQVGDSHYMEFTVRVAPGTPTGQILWSCWWTWSETEDPYHANNVVDAYLFVHDGTSPVGDLSIQAAAAVVSGSGASADQAALETYEAIGTEVPVRVGGTVKMRFWATNAGPVASRGQYALILDEVAISVVDVTLAQGWVSPSGPSSAVWDSGVIQPGQTVNLDLTVRLNTTGAIKLFARRISGSPGDPNASNEHAEIVLDGYGPNATGRWVAVGDVDGAGQGEILTGTGQGETPQVRVYTGTGADTGVRFFAYERPFLGGVRIASCDVNGDGIDELITAPGPGRAPTIRALSLVGGVVTELIAFDAFEPGFTGGATIACADLDADGSAEVIVGAGPGRAPEVQVYSVGLSSITPRATFLAYEAGFLGGVRVAAGVYAGRAGWLDAFAIATTPGVGRAAELRLWTPTGGPVAQVVVSSATKGVLPTLGDVNGDGKLDLLLTPDDGRPELVRIFSVDTGEVLGDVQGGLPAFPVGIRTAVGVLEGGPGQPELVIGNGPGGHPRVRVVFWPPAGPAQRLEILPLEIP